MRRYDIYCDVSLNTKPYISKQVLSRYGICKKKLDPDSLFDLQFFGFIVAAVKN